MPRWMIDQSSHRNATWLAVSALLILLTRVSHSQFETCVDINAPINSGTGAIAQQIQPATIAKLATSRVRVNCILGPWSSPSDATLHAGKTWFQTYDQIVNDFLAQGTGVYMLIGSQAVSSGFGFNTTQF